MKHLRSAAPLAAILAILTALPIAFASDAGVKTKTVEGFGGVIAERYEDSKEWWPPEKRPNKGAPNVIIFLLDDVLNFPGHDPTGVEMEALTGLSVALLTIWDLTKPVNPALEITGQRLLFKSGGKHGEWIHPDGMPPEVEKILAGWG